MTPGILKSGTVLINKITTNIYDTISEYATFPLRVAEYFVPKPGVTG